MELSYKRRASWMGYGWIALTLLALFVSTAYAGKPAKENKAHFDTGTYTVDVALDRRWNVRVDQNNRFVIFDYAERPPVKGEYARLGLFHFVVPPASRGADKIDIGSEYAVKDVGGIQQGLFGSVYTLRPASRRPRVTEKGVCYEFRELIELGVGGTRSTKFVRAAVCYPPTFERDGGLFLLVGMQQFNEPHLIPGALDKMADILDGLSVKDSSQ